MPKYEFKCPGGHKTEKRMSFSEFEARDRRIRCHWIVGSGGRACDFSAFPTFHAVQFTVEPGWWDDEIDRTQVNNMLRK